MKTDGELIACKIGRFLQRSPKQDRTLDIFSTELDLLLIRLVVHGYGSFIHSLQQSSVMPATKQTFNVNN
jgi:hypothetical protein